MEERYHSALGIRNDFEEYRKLLESKQSIPFFPAGKFDIYDQFHIPQKLYGREAELNILLKEFDRICQGEARLLLVYGYSGIGKSSIIYEIQNPVAQKKGYFISGKYDQFKKNVPYSAIIQAFQGLIQQILCETEDRILRWEALLLQELGANAQVIIDVIPEVEFIIGKQPPVIQLDFQQSEKRFIATLTKFIEFFLKPEHPIVLFMDDLQWIDHSSLKFLQTFVCDSLRKYLLIIGSYRDNEVGLNHPLTFALKAIKKEGKTYETLELQPLSLFSINQLISDTFHNTLQQSHALSEIVYQKTGGNPFFTIQFLKMLYKEGFLDFDAKQQQWIANLPDIQHMRVTDNVAELMGQRIQKLPVETQNLLKIGSAIGNIFDLQTVSNVSEYELSVASSHLQIALEEELILLKEGFEQEAKESEKEHKSFFAFQHDRIQQAAYKLISEESRNATHYLIGQVLLKQTPPELRKDSIITIVNQLNYGTKLVKSEEEKILLAQLNLEAGQKAQDSSAQPVAIQYFNTGIELLGELGWEKNYSLQFTLHEHLSISEHLSGNFEQTKKTLATLFKNVQTTTERFKLYVLRIKFHLEMNDLQPVYRYFVEAIKLLNFDLELNPTPEMIFSEIERVRKKLNERNLTDLSQLPPLKNENIRILCSLLNIMSIPAYCCRGSFFLLLAPKFLDLTLTYGLAEENLISVALFGMALQSEFIQEYREGIKCHQLALNWVRKKASIYTRLNIEFMAQYNSNRFIGPAKEIVEILRNLAPKSLEVGDIMLGAGSYLYMSYYDLILGKPLEFVQNEIQHNLAQSKLVTAPRAHSLLKLMQEIVMALRGLSKDPLDPRPLDLIEIDCGSLEKGEDAFLYLTWRIFILYLHEKYEEAHKLCLELYPFSLNLPSNPLWMVYYTYYALTVAALCKPCDENKNYKQELQKAVRRTALWSELSPSNYLHLHLLIKAEAARVFKDYESAINHYEWAMSAAEEQNFLHEAGIICELAGKFHFDQKRTKLASYYWSRALHFYTQWGATTKIKQFKRKYQKFTTDAFFSLRGLENHTNREMKETTVESLEVSSILQAAQAISKEIVLEKLLQTLMHIVKVEAGAEKVFFIMPKREDFCVQAEASHAQENITMLGELSIDKKSEELCVNIIHYVFRTKENLLLNDAENEGLFQNDPYVKRKKTKSILCFPLLHLGKVIAILYLENNLTKGAFTQEHLYVLELLSAQMGISIENAKFYAKLEEMVADRTLEVKEKNEELSQALDNLTKMQKQMIQQEKLASLGLLSSGIAHELKNPLNFVINFSELVSSSIEEMNKKLTLNEKIECEELKNEFQSLGELMQKVMHHSKRADGIVKGLLSHAFKGGAKAEKASIPGIIDQALSLTLQVFRKKEPNFILEVITQYDPKLQPQEVFMGELTRVFINLIENACFAMNKKFKVESQFKPKIEITVKDDLKNVEIRVRDNGGGIEQGHLDKVFQPFFTTKEVGEGTGLGLSISYDIVTQQHGGTFAVFSDGKSFTEFLITLPKK